MPFPLGQHHALSPKKAYTKLFRRKSGHFFRSIIITEKNLALDSLYEYFFLLFFECPAKAEKNIVVFLCKDLDT